MTLNTEVEWEEADCDFCGRSKGELVLEGPDRLLHLPGRFRVVKCPRCGLLRQNPRPTRATIDFYYPPNYEPFMTAIEDEERALVRWDRRYGMRKRVRLIERLQSGGRLLDVGSATGLFLAEMQRTGRWSTFGVEPSDAAASYARKRFGLEIFQGTLDELPPHAGPFDVVTLWNVLEHLHAPVSALRRVASLLAPKGWAVVTIPGMDSFEAMVFGRSWIGWELPRHLYWFPVEHLPDMFRAAGLEIQDTQCLMSGHNTFGLSLRFWLAEHLHSPKMQKSVLRVYGSFPVRGALSPFWWTLAQCKRLTLLTVVAQKSHEKAPHTEAYKAGQEDA